MYCAFLSPLLSSLLYSAVLVLLRCSLPVLLLMMTRIIIRFFYCASLSLLFSSLLYSGALVLRCFSVLFLCNEVAVVFVFRWCSPKYHFFVYGGALLPLGWHWHCSARSAVNKAKFSLLSSLCTEKMQHRPGIAQFLATIYLHNHFVFGAEKNISPVT